MRMTDDNMKISRIKSYHKIVSRLNSMLKNKNSKIIKQNEKQIKTKNFKMND